MLSTGSTNLCAPTGHKDWQPWVIDNEAEVDKLLKGAFDRGLNTWDTANVYSNGESEVRSPEGGCRHVRDNFS
jgi:aryl-alcohol dehydrogenase-like predicted oxidoreductase